MSEEQLSKKERKALKKQEQAAQKTAAANARRDRTRNRIMIITVSSIVIVGFLFWLIANAPEGPRLLDDTPTEINAVGETDNTKGALPGTGAVTIVEYSDFQCPACAAYYPVIKQLVEDYPNDVTFVYRHLPIRTIHPNAELASRYVEAASLQDKFFEMHDIVFDNQAAWSPLSSRAARSAFESYGETIGLDVEKLTEDATLESVAAKIEADRIDAIGAGALATPSFFVNGELLSQNPGSYEEFVEIVTGENPSAPAANTQIDISDIQKAIESNPGENADSVEVIKVETENGSLEVTPEQ